MIQRIRKQERILGSLSILGLILAALVSTLYHTSIDMTKNKAFTLSVAAKNLHDEIPESVRISYFVSRSLADRHPGPAAIEDFLMELESANKGKIRVRTLDPAKDDTEAKQFGLAPQQMQVVERSEQRVALVYTGIVVEYLDRFETIPAILSTETLEYEIVKTVRRVISGRSFVAGLLVGDGDKTIADDYQSLSGSLLRAGYEPREIRPAEAIDDDVDLVFVLGNDSLDRYDASFIDAFLMRGGKAFFALKGVTVDPERGLAASAVPAGGLLSILSAYGIEIQSKLVLDQSNLTVPFQTQSPTGSRQIQYVRYPHWVAVDYRFVDTSSPMTAGFAGLDLYWPSPMSIRPLSGVTYTELAKTTPKAWLQSRQFATGPDEQALYGLEKEESTGQYLLAVSASGSLPSAFSAGDIPYREGAASLPMARAKVSEPTRIVVVSSADFLTDLMTMSDSGFNALFAVSAADWLCSRDDLIAIRSRALVDTRLNRIQDEGQKAFMIGLTYIVTLGLIPFGIIAFGLLRASRRNRAERESRCRRGVES
ncbi:GldG family protein [Spirochaetota bacterium]